MRTAICACSGCVVDGSLSRLTEKLRLACGVGRRQVVERLLDGLDLLIGEAELIAGKPGPLLRRRNRHVAFEIEVRRRRAVEEAAGDIDLGGICLRDAVRSAR